MAGIEILYCRAGGTIPPPGPRRKRVDSDEDSRRPPELIALLVGEFDQDSCSNERFDCSIHVLWSDAQFSRKQACIDDGVAEKHVEHSPCSGVASQSERALPLGAGRVQVRDEAAPVVDRDKHGGRELLHDRARITGPVGGQGVKVGVDVREQPGRYRNGYVPGEAFVAKLSVQKCSARSTVSIRKRVDRFKLCVRDRCLGQGRHVLSCDVSKEVLDCGGEMAVVRRYAGSWSICM